ncbi:hypothetical protein [Halorubrum sp. DTA98]|uniref:hypothetical protein n=1 Tax=Halorubrum sp. DTA98 TaxID=3402163 RepID=UPI003AAC5864
MRLFGGGDENKRAERLANNAKGESVTLERLTTIERGFGKGRDYLANSSVLDWLKDSEQPHFIFPSRVNNRIKRQAGSDLEPNGEYRVVLVVTSERVLFLIGDKSDDRSLTIEYGDISGIGFVKQESSGMLEPSVATLKVETKDETYFFQLSGEDEGMETASEYILEASEVNEDIQADFETPKTVGQEARERSDRRLEQATNNPNDQGPQPIYSGKGGKVRIEGNTKQRENCGGVEVYEGKIKVEKKGMINRSWITIPISEIRSVDSTVFGKVSIVTDANDYTISGCSIATQLVDFVNKWEDESNRGNQGDAISAAEGIERFAELNEKGIISDEEFEKKKEELL